MCTGKERKDREVSEKLASSKGKKKRTCDSWFLRHTRERKKKQKVVNDKRQQRYSNLQTLSS